MPRPTKKPAAVANSFVASAAQITSRRRVGAPKDTGGNTGWQAEVWSMLDMVGELEFYREWITNALSRCTLKVMEEVYDTETKQKVRREVTTGLPADAMAALFDGEAGQSQMLGAMGGHISLPGETWLVGLVEPSDQADGPDQWRILARDEVKLEGSQWVIDRGDGIVERYEDGSKEDKPAQALVIRVWRPHPRKWVEATSSVRSALPILRELVGLTQHTAASIDSRLAGAGILFVPSEMSFSTPNPGEDAAPADLTADAFMSTLVETMAAAIRDRGSAEALAPIVVKAPGALIANVKHITFATEFTKEARELRVEAIGRLATALDIPREVLLGMADVNHWTGWLLDENAIKMHVEPVLEVIAHGLTTRYLWPCLQGNAATLDPAMRRFSLEGDTSALRQRPNRSAEAQALHKDMVITDKALARETGFEADDLLSSDENAEEFKRRLVQNVAGGVTTADLTAAALAFLGAGLAPKAAEVDTTTASDPAALPAPPPPADNVDDRTPPEQTAQATAIILGSEAVVLRAVEKAWNRAGKRSRSGRTAIPADQLEACLSGAWEYVPRIAAMTGTDEARLTRTLDTYTRTLLATGAEHDPVALARQLVEQVLTAPPEALSA